MISGKKPFVVSRVFSVLIRNVYVYFLIKTVKYLNWTIILIVLSPKFGILYQQGEAKRWR